ncbi:hypothetical protein [Bauldia sp.]|uniref:hypothetical protein n=1 Tax=Bauldia sp. TaxID=2575872 RepID=UPI003BA85E12
MFAALIVPAVENVRSLLRLDGAAMTFEVMRPGTINVGSDDTPASQQVDVISQHVHFLVSALVNRGLSPAAVQPDFKCSATDRFSGATVTGIFHFIDINSQKKILEDITVNAGETVFVNTILDSFGTKEFGYESTERNETCELIYSDKYGSKWIVSDISSYDYFPLASPGVTDSRVEVREKYCVDMIRGIKLGDEPIDCISDSHILAIEPIYLWERAFGRAIRQADEFTRSTQENAVRTPGLVLVDCDDANCAQEYEEMRSALKGFVPRITVWLCDPSDTPSVRRHGDGLSSFCTVVLK